MRDDNDRGPSSHPVTIVLNPSWLAEMTRVRPLHEHSESRDAITQSFPHRLAGAQPTHENAA